MNKRLLSITIALLLAAVPAGVASNAAEAKTPNTSGDVTGTIKFDMGDWDHSHKACFYIWDATNGMKATKSGWQEGDTWGTKKIMGTAVEGEDGVYESYEFTIPEGHDLFIIVSDYTTNEQTYDCTLDASALGDTLYMTGNMLENPVDSEKLAIEAKFKNADCGPYKQITSTGNIVGEYTLPSDNVAAKVASYVFNMMGTVDKLGEECCNVQKVAAAIASFGTTADDVWAEFEKFADEEGYAAKVDDAKALIFGSSSTDTENTDTAVTDSDSTDTEEPVTDTDSTDTEELVTDTDSTDTEETYDSDKVPEDVTGTIKFDMGDWNHDDKICFYIWDATNGMKATKSGWQEGDTWGTKKIMGTAVEGEDGVYESYEFTIPEGHDLFIIVSDYNTNEQTYDCTLDASALGDTLYMTGNMLENPVDSEKLAIEAKFKNADCGPYKQITSTGNIVGEYTVPSDNGAAKVANYLFNYGDNAVYCTPEKVAELITAFDTSVKDVWTELQTFADREGYSDKIENIKNILFPTESPDVPDPQPAPTGLWGDVNGDGKVTAADSMAIQRYSVKLINLDNSQKLAADVNRDGKVTAADAMQILRYTIHLKASEGIGEPIVVAAG